MSEGTQETIDDAVDSATDFLEGLVEGAVSWLHRKAQDLKERRTRDAQEDREKGDDTP